jgi:arsenite-transporting ATPase
MADGIGALRRSGIAVADVIVNRLVPDGPRCRLCDLRRAAQRAALARWWRGAIARLPRRNLYEDLPEPRGAKALAALGQRLRKGDRQLASPRRRRLGPKAAAVEMSGRGVSSAPFLGAIAGTQLLFFGGKGGVGKTTAAAATALRLARETGGRVLLLSTDPAHSLADVFGQPIGDRLTTINGGPSNLQVRELDAAAALAARRSELEAAVQEIVATFGAPGARAMPELFDLAPPGIDELVGILSVVDARSTYQTIVVDTAPTGHALRLLEMPAVAQEWVQALLRVLLKHRDLLRPGQLAAELVELSKSVRGLRELMHDPRQTRFVVVTRAADVPRRETVRLLRRLRKIQLATAAIVVNARTLAPGACPRCRATAAAEEQQVAALSRACGRRPCAIIQAPLSAPAPRGVRALERWGQSWMS